MSNDETQTQLVELLSQYTDEIVDTWVSKQQEIGRNILSEEELEAQARLMLDEIMRALEDEARLAQEDNQLLALLARLSQTRARQGFTPRENARFLLNLKEALLPVLRKEFGRSPSRLAALIEQLSNIVDELALYTFEVYLEGREQYIREQQEAIIELSTPVLEIWENILTLPLIGALDTHRAQQMTETVLETIVARRANVVIIDITGVSVVDTAVAKHLIQTVKAIRLLGASTIIVGISAQVAQTMVQLGIDLGNVKTRTSLGGGLRLALQETGWELQRANTVAR
ncbi:MAG: STAS domain-containing protein [Chloroflexota bacterium]|nr:STAS domain-containing protein [Chloroflexota bacterium]